ncbi:MAG TPA: TRAP transporter small permease [Burkholderiales bacterium]|nr:TRAP transporter small permease [Burkholderiales bacterium]
MDEALRLARLIARAGTWFGGILVALAAVLISVDVLMRKFLGVPLGGSTEYSGYILGIGSAWALALALLDRAHVRIDSLYMLAPARLCALLDILALGAFMVFGALATWQGALVFQQSWAVSARSLTPLETPLAVPQFLWVAGFAMFFAVLVLLLVRAVIIVFTGRAEDVQRLIGPRTVQQELAEAIEEHSRYRAPQA